MRSWSKRTVELSLTLREAERLLVWLDSTCSDRTADRAGFQLAYTLRGAMDGEQPPTQPSSVER